MTINFIEVLCIAMSEETKSTKIQMDMKAKPKETSKESNEADDADDNVKIKSTEASASTSTTNAALVPLVNPQQQNQSAEILKLVTDCFDELFEYLPLKDILCMGQTCKRLHQIVLYILRQYFSAAELLLPTGNDLRIGNVDEVNICMEFIEFAHKVSVYGNSGFRYLNQIQSKFGRLQHIYLHSAEINRHKMTGLEEIFDKLEVLQLSMCDIAGSVHETILAFCPHIKRFSLMDWSSESDTNDIDLFHHKYPSLEHFELVSHRRSGLVDFLKLNPNVRSLSISCRSWINSERLVDLADIHLAELAILNCEIDGEFVRTIKELHKRDFYQRLSLYFTRTELVQDNVDQLATLEGIVKLYLGGRSIWADIAISALSSLEELCLDECNRITDLETAAIQLSRLGRIHFKYASLDDIWPFIRQARRVKKIKVENLSEGIHFSHSNNVINLVALNEEREKLADAQKLTIYVKEKLFLATKWTLKEIDFRSIRLKREESYEWIHDFDGFL